MSRYSRSIRGLARPFLRRPNRSQRVSIATADNAARVPVQTHLRVKVRMRVRVRVRVRARVRVKVKVRVRVGVGVRVRGG